MKKSKLIVNSKSSSASTAVVLMALAALFIILGVLFGKGRMMVPFSISNWEMMEYVILPLLASVLFIACILLLGRKLFILSVIPLVMAVVSTMTKAFEMTSLEGYLELIICIVLIVIYCCTIYGTVRRFFFAAVTVILIAYHAYFVVYKQITNTDYFYSFSQLAFEIGALFMYLGFIFAVCGATRKRTINPETATMVTPPIPGGRGLSEVKNSSVSAPEPVKEQKTVTDVEEITGQSGTGNEKNDNPDSEEVKAAESDVIAESAPSYTGEAAPTLPNTQETAQTASEAEKIADMTMPTGQATEQTEEITPEPDYREVPKKTKYKFFNWKSAKKESTSGETEEEKISE